MTSIIALSQMIKTKALTLGFEDCGFAQATELVAEGARLNSWLEKNYHAGMAYMEKNLEKRKDPRILFQGAQSVISVIYNYYPGEKQNSNDTYKISSYALGTDYHLVIKRKLKQIMSYISGLDKNFLGRSFVDSAPVMDKVWAVKAGLGWIGKNSCLITRRWGSYFFVGEIITNLELDYNTSLQKDLCGGCTRCINACPAGAIVAPYIIDSAKCISYQTIENKQEIPNGLKGKMNHYIFGCDICQQVCPWNKSAKKHTEPLFFETTVLALLNNEGWEQMTEEKFNTLFKYSPLKRAGYHKIMNTVAFVNAKQ